MLKKLLISLLFLSAVVHAEEIEHKGKVSLGGNLRFRGEGKQDIDFNKNRPDATRDALMRMRLDLTFQPQSDMTIFLQPQAARTWGKTEVINNVTTNTSGATQDSRLDFHQAYINYQLMDSVALKIGRQILTYGDELLIGVQDWNNNGRSFDAVKATSQFGAIKMDLFWSKLIERNDTPNGSSDKNFYGAYFTTRVADWMKAADLYWLRSKDSFSPSYSTNAVGARIKSTVGDETAMNADYRAEATFESVRPAVDGQVTGESPSKSERQIDAELGYTLIPSSKTRVSVEYFMATRNFDQLYPSQHKWLGYADMLIRKNVEGMRAGVSSDFADNKLNLQLDFHLFKRHDNDAPVYYTSGASLGNVGSAKNVAKEVDVVAKYKLNDLMTTSVGGAMVKADDYLKTNKGSDNNYFYYIDLVTNF